METVLITGANCGIGLACVAELLARERRVFAVVRSGTPELAALQAAYPQQLSCLNCDLADPEAIAALPQRLSEQTLTLDWLINNAGVLTDHETIADLRAADLAQNYAVNAIAPALCVQALLPFLRRSQHPIIANISSSFASIGRKAAGMPARYSYAMSKAALNMFTKTLALELASEGIVAAAIHPGWTRTRIGGPEATLSPEAAAHALLDTISSLTIADTGTFRTCQGGELAW